MECLRRRCYRSLPAYYHGLTIIVVVVEKKKKKFIKTIFFIIGLLLITKIVGFGLRRDTSMPIENNSTAFQYGNSFSSGFDECIRRQFNMMVYYF